MPVKRKNSEFKNIKFYELQNIFTSSTLCHLATGERSLLEVPTVPTQHGFEKSLNDHYITIIL